jgi:predicted metal-binding membrane protein
VVEAVGQVEAIAGLVVVAVAWQLAPSRRRGAARCHRTIAPPLDADEALVECRRFGGRLGVDCVSMCWALMAVMAAAGHGLLAVVPLFCVSWYERRRRPHHDPRTMATAGVMAGTGVALLALMPLVGVG